MKDAKIFDDIDTELLKKFKAYHLENPHVYDEFLSNALKMKSLGRRKYSAWTIVNKIRWDWDVQSSDRVFKINNDFIALYARLVIYHRPEFTNFFEMRKMKAFDRRQSSEEQYRRSV